MELKSDQPPLDWVPADDAEFADIGQDGVPMLQFLLSPPLAYRGERKDDGARHLIWSKRAVIEQKDDPDFAKAQAKARMKEMIKSAFSDDR